MPQAGRAGNVDISKLAESVAQTNHKVFAH